MLTLYLNTMEGYDALSVPYMDSPLSLDDVTAAEYMHMLPSYSYPEPSASYAAGHLLGDAQLPFLPQSLPCHEAQSYTTAYEDSVSDTKSYVGTASPDQPVPEATSVERGNTLLSFQLPTYRLTLLDYAFRRTTLSLTAQLHGMFFLAESLRTPVGDGPIPPAELTCYRRNLFQITGSITFPRGLRYVVTEQGEKIPILTQELCISATESVEGNPIKIISIPWKTPSSTAGSVTEEKTEKEPISIPLDVMSNQDMGAEYVTFPIAWKRLQFRVATANNGRRKELQQHFIIKLSVVASLSSGIRVSICEAISGAVIVRGRSPRNFQQRKDYPLSGSGGLSRRGMQIPPPLTRSPTSDSTTLQMPMKVEPGPEQILTAATHYSPSMNQNPNIAFVDWNSPPTNTYTPRSTPTVTTSPQSPAAPVYARRSPDHGDSRKSAYRRQPPTPPTPAALSIVDMGNATYQSSPTSSYRCHKVARTRTTTSPTRPVPSLLHSAEVSAALLSNNTPAYSYHSSLPGARTDTQTLAHETIPPGLENWMPQVEAVYRPHTVHQTNRATLVEAGGVKDAGRYKRSYTEDTSSDSFCHASADN